MWVDCSPIAQESGVQSQIKSYQKLKKWYLIPPCLTLSIIRYGSRVKLSNPIKKKCPFLHFGQVANKRESNPKVPRFCSS